MEYGNLLIMNQPFSQSSKIILYALPFAGGNAISYRAFHAYIPDFILFKPLDFPGRGKRAREPLFTELNAIVEDLFTQIQEEIKTQTYAIYGHSMGAQLGYSLTRRILHTGLPAPRHLFFSGRRGPSVANKKPPKHQLPKAEFFSHLRDLGGCPREILEDTMLMDFFEPILRADFKVLETHIHQPVPPFDIPMTILGGLKDDEVTYEDLQAWQCETSQLIKIKQFPGDHFFIFDHSPQLCQLFAQTLMPFLKGQQRVI
jgi:surfactin synthase thioesterase subunit